MGVRNPFGKGVQIRWTDLTGRSLLRPWPRDGWWDVDVEDTAGRWVRWMEEVQGLDADGGGVVGARGACDSWMEDGRRAGSPLLMGAHGRWAGCVASRPFLHRDSCRIGTWQGIRFVSLR